MTAKKPRKPSRQIEAPEGEELWTVMGWTAPDKSDPFVTGVLVVKGVVVSAPPLIRWTVGEPLSAVRLEASKRGWEMTQAHPLEVMAMIQQEWETLKDESQDSGPKPPGRSPPDGGSASGSAESSGTPTS